MADDTLRIDKFLWFARLAKTREFAQAIAESGHLRLAGRRIDRAHALVRVGDVLSFALHGKVRVLRVEALPARRGPPAEARMLYSELTEQGVKSRATVDPSDVLNEGAMLSGASRGETS